VHAALVGFGLGFFVAVQLGPMSLFLIRSTLRRGLAVGLSIGAGIAFVDAAYATLGAAGAAPLVSIGPLRLVLGLAGAGVLVALGARTLWSAFRVRSGGEADVEVSTRRRAFFTAVAATASNPLTIVSWAAIFAGASAAGAADTTPSAILLVCGVAVGSATWFTALATGVSVAGRALHDRALRIVDAVAGAALVVFGGLLAFETLDR
jgi:threonine/homoserine/homoserine lactone efflux protein